MSQLFSDWIQLFSRWLGFEPTPPVIPAPVPTPAPLPPSPESKVAGSINEARASAELGPLARDPLLDRSAGAWASVMASADDLGHGDFAGRITAIYPNDAGGEDIAEGQPDAASVVAAWMDSPPHRANILGDFDRLGVGSARDDSGAIYWCVDFIEAT